METLSKRLAEQKGRHQGGSKWIGTAGTSPFGAYGFNPEGVRIGQEESRHRRAVKVWDRREFREPRRFGRARHAQHQGGVEAAAGAGSARAPRRSSICPAPSTRRREHGYLDLRMRPERNNAVRVLMLYDIGGSMDDHVRVVEELFSAARAEFSTSCISTSTTASTKASGRTIAAATSNGIGTDALLNTYGRDYKVIVVGDASMSAYELLQSGGSVEHWNAEPGKVWLERLLAPVAGRRVAEPRASRALGLHPVDRHGRGIFVRDRMFPLTLAGLDEAVRTLARRTH